MGRLVLKFFKCLICFCFPALIWNAPLKAEEIPPIEKPQKEIHLDSPWDLLSYENLSFDRIMSVVNDFAKGGFREVWVELGKCC